MKIGFIGLGIMGAPMAANIIRKHGDKVYLANRTVDKAKALAAELASDPNAALTAPEALSANAELARLSDLIITMVPKTEDVERVYGEILPEITPGKICIDMSTIAPAASVAIAEKVIAKGGLFADAPVVKSKAAAIAGKLGIYVGSSEETFETIRPVLSYMGENIIRLGENGSGLVMKLCHNALVSQIQNGVNETITVAKASGIDVRTYARAISYGGGQNAYLDNHVEPLQNDDFSTAFSLENAAKDVNLFLSLAEESGIPVPGEKNVAAVYDRSLAAGYAKEDWAATIKAVRDFS